MKKKNQHQIKSSWYYVFWSIMALSVVAGQIYVGTGYREMSESMKETKEALVYLEMERLSRSQHIQ